MFKHKTIYLRAVEEMDLEKIRLMRNDPSTWMNLTNISFLDTPGQKAWFEGLSKKKSKYRYFTVCGKKDIFVGIVRMDEIDTVNRSVRVGCDVSQKLRGRGYGQLIMEAIKEYCFKYMNMHRLWLAVMDYNKAARHVYEKAGFSQEGCYRQAIYRNGVYHDYILMSLIKNEKGGR